MRRKLRLQFSNTSCASIERILQSFENLSISVLLHRTLSFHALNPFVSTSELLGMCGVGLSLQRVKRRVVEQDVGVLLEKSRIIASQKKVLVLKPRDVEFQGSNYGFQFQNPRVLLNKLHPKSLRFASRSIYKKLNISWRSVFVVGALETHSTDSRNFADDFSEKWFFCSSTEPKMLPVHLNSEILSHQPQSCIQTSRFETDKGFGSGTASSVYFFLATAKSLNELKTGTGPLCQPNTDKSAGLHLIDAGHHKLKLMVPKTRLINGQLKVFTADFKSLYGFYGMLLHDLCLPLFTTASSASVGYRDAPHCSTPQSRCLNPNCPFTTAPGPDTGVNRTGDTTVNNAHSTPSWSGSPGAYKCLSTIKLAMGSWRPVLIISTRICGPLPPPPADSKGSTPQPPVEPNESKSSQVFQVKIGTVEGVVSRTEFSAYAPDNSFLYTFVAQSVKIALTILVRKPAEDGHVIIPRGACAKVSDWKNEPIILFVHISADFPYTADLFPTTRTRRTLKFVQAASLDRAQTVGRARCSSASGVVAFTSTLKVVRQFFNTMQIQKSDFPDNTELLYCKTLEQACDLVQKRAQKGAAATVYLFLQIDRDALCGGRMRGYFERKRGNSPGSHPWEPFPFAAEAYQRKVDGALAPHYDTLAACLPIEASRLRRSRRSAFCRRDSRRKGAEGTIERIGKPSIGISSIEGLKPLILTVRCFLIRLLILKG
ncbi:hypothetical protein B0H13DRAFT_2458011 [Mycena leptocephala]|nr:hypothetical protein B0H13DRAFT_2458011 [Mycena leptocephala]